ncbi:MAG TPA: tetratricopeptide repeat protein, partial [Isosphaeraceae bacterium]|nr:tetratricopeptide repeat protein [Isosphaeraceae bacterium]
MPSAWGVLVTLLALGAGPTPKDRLWTRADEDAKTEAKRRYDAGAYDQAIPFYDAVLERHPRDQDSRRDRGACYLRMNQPERALADFDALVGYNPGWPGGWTNRGNALLMLGRPELALETFQ